jgi:hypothetical protein
MLDSVPQTYSGSRRPDYYTGCSLLPEPVPAAGAGAAPVSRLPAVSPDSGSHLVRSVYTCCQVRNFMSIKLGPNLVKARRS